MSSKEGLYRVSWTMASVIMPDGTISNNIIKMSELFRGVNSGDEAIVAVHTRYPPDKWVVRITSVSQLR